MIEFMKGFVNKNNLWIFYTLKIVTSMGTLVKFKTETNFFNNLYMNANNLLVNYLNKLLNSTGKVNNKTISGVRHTLMLIPKTNSFVKACLKEE